MIISKKRIKAAGCILPVSHSMDIPKELGLRHRAAKGISQETDALAVIDFRRNRQYLRSYKDTFHLRLSAEELERFLHGRPDYNQFITQTQIRGVPLPRT